LKHDQIITRRKRFDGKKFWVTTISQQRSDGKWANCLYLHFVKSEFPQIASPPLIDCEWRMKKRRFDYDNSVLNQLDWHGGITFYEETKNLEDDEIYVKVGCDYSHYRDFEYESHDCGDELLADDAILLVEEFEQLVTKIGSK
jgi:hypothetical protein